MWVANWFFSHLFTLECQMITLHQICYWCKCRFFCNLFCETFINTFKHKKQTQTKITKIGSSHSLSAAPVCSKCNLLCKDTSKEIYEKRKQNCSIFLCVLNFVYILKLPKLQLWFLITYFWFVVLFLFVFFVVIWWKKNYHYLLKTKLTQLILKQKT